MQRTGQPIKIRVSSRLYEQIEKAIVQAIHSFPHEQKLSNNLNIRGLAYSREKTSETSFIDHQSGKLNRIG